MDINERRKKAIELTQALIDGKQLEWHDLSYPKWVPLTDVQFIAFVQVERIRIKPEPRVVYRLEWSDGIVTFQTSLTEADKLRNSYTYTKYIEELPQD